MPGPEQDQKDGGLRLDTDKWNVLYGDPSARDGYFIGGAGEKGARWATTGGGFTGKVGEDGLQSHIGLGGDYGLQLSSDFKAQSAQLGMMSGGTSLFNLYGQGKGLDDFETGIRGNYGLGGGYQLDPSLAYLESGGKGSEVARLGLSNGDTRFGSSFSHGDDGNKLSLDFSQPATGGYTSTRSSSINFGAGTADNSFKLTDPNNTFGFNQSLGPGGEKDSLNFSHKYGMGSVSGSLTMGDDLEKFSLGASQSLGGAGSLSERFGMSFGPGGPTTSFGMGADLKQGGFNLGTSFDASVGPHGGFDLNGKLNEGYRSPVFGQSLSLGGSSSSEKGESFNATGSATGQLLPNLYAGGFGNYNVGPGADPSYFAGGGLTYMPTSKLGLTAAGGYGSEGWETRLQADFFKKGIDGAGTLEDQRKKAMFSAYLGVSGGGGNHMNDVFGAPDVGKSWNNNTGPTVSLGVGVGF